VSILTIVNQANVASATPGQVVRFNDYRVVVPFVRPDTYSGDLIYVAMTS
jgi:hypothetical protein